jgi:hypothetical protein
MSASPRQLLAGLLPNLRDCGGLGTEDGRVLRSRCLLRSAALVGLPPATLTAFLDTVGTGTYFDLRTDAEIERDGSPSALIDAGWRWERVSIDDGNSGEGSVADIARRSISAIPKYLAAAERVTASLGPRPVLVACAAGKDRTGMVTAITLHRLGIRRAQILEDFTLSNSCLREGRALLPARWQNPDHHIHPVDATVCAVVLDRVPATRAPQRRADISPLTFPAPLPRDSAASPDATVVAAARRR